MAQFTTEDLLSAIEMARSRFVYGIGKVPDDRLTWTPGGASRSALELAGRLAGFLGFMAHMLATQEMPQGGGPAEGPSSREAAVAAVEGGFRGLSEVIGGLSDADMEKAVPVPWGGTVPVRRMAPQVLGVIGYFQGQLNLVQLAYGDEDPNIPPEWRHE